MITILGSTGMLGSMVAKVLPASRRLTRGHLDARIAAGIPDYDEGPVINCIGLIKPYCDDIVAAIETNSVYPYKLPKGTIQIATDCVYTGKKGDYVETDPHDALDVYGKTKSLGEAPHLYNLRCSIIGPELKNHISLLDWFLAQKKANGFTNHKWNGITTLAFAKICKGIIDNNIELPQLQHIVPADTVTKAELLKIIAEEYEVDIPVTEVEAPEAIDRTLATLNPDLNLKLWQAAGYENIPTIRELVRELAHYEGVNDSRD